MSKIIQLIIKQNYSTISLDNMPQIIQTNPNILGGMPTITGTRIPVARIMALYVQGYKVSDFRRDYPYLKISKKDLLTIFRYYTNQLAKG